MALICVGCCNLRATVTLACTQRLKYSFLIHEKFCSMAISSSPGLTSPVTFETSLEELEQLVAQLESGAMPLEQLLGGYQRGAELLKFCRDRLEAVEGQVKVLDQGALKTWTSE